MIWVNLIANVLWCYSMCVCVCVCVCIWVNTLTLWECIPQERHWWCSLSTDIFYPQLWNEEEHRWRQWQ